MLVLGFCWSDFVIAVNKYGRHSHPPLSPAGQRGAHVGLAAPAHFLLFILIIMVVIINTGATPLPISRLQDSAARTSASPPSRIYYYLY